MVHPRKNIDKKNQLWYLRNLRYKKRSRPNMLIIVGSSMIQMMLSGFIRATLTLSQLELPTSICYTLTVLVLNELSNYISFKLLSQSSSSLSTSTAVILCSFCMNFSLSFLQILQQKKKIAKIIKAPTESIHKLTIRSERVKS